MSDVLLNTLPCINIHAQLLLHCMQAQRVARRHTEYHGVGCCTEQPSKDGLVETLPRMATAMARVALCKDAVPVEEPVVYGVLSKSAFRTRKSRPSRQQYISFVIESACHLTKLKCLAAAHVQAGTALLFDISASRCIGGCSAANCLACILCRLEDIIASG